MPWDNYTPLGAHVSLYIGVQRVPPDLAVGANVCQVPHGFRPTAKSKVAPKLQCDCIEEEAQCFCKLNSAETAAHSHISLRVFPAQRHQQSRSRAPPASIVRRRKELTERKKETQHSAKSIPFLVKLPGDFFNLKERTKISQEVIGAFAALIKDHKDGYDESKFDCFASAFMKEMNMHQKANTQTSFSFESLVFYAITIHIAQSATLYTVDWSLALLANNPKMQQRMYTEIAEQVGNCHAPTTQEMSKLPYVVAFYMEVMRFCNITIQSLPRAATAETKLGGYTIPTNAMLRPDFDSIFADETIWGDPDVFRPDRFLDEYGAFQNNKFFKPFSYGPRDCLGTSFGKMELFLLISSVVQKFRILRPEGADLSMKTIDGEFRFGHAPKPYRIIAIARE